MRKQVVIVGAGPSGLLLGRLLDLAGIDNIVLERQTQDYVLARIRAGILEQTTVDLIHRAGAGTRLDAEGIRHHALHLAFDYKSIPIGLSEHTNGKVVTAYGQTEVTRDLCSVRDAASAVVAIRSGAGARVEAPRQRSASASERRMTDLKPPEHIETVAPDPSKPPKR